MRQTLRRIINSNPQLSTAWWHLQMRLAEARGCERVIVYQMGKVGSSTIIASLHALPQSYQLHHVHTLTRQGISEAEAIYRTITRTTGKNVAARASHLQSSRYLIKQLADNGRAASGDKKWKIVTLVREPIARNISSFFQTIDYYLPNFMQRYAAGELDIAAVTQTYLDSFDHAGVLRWFDEELRPALGIDVYAEPFPHARGYKIYRGERCDLLLLKLETLNHYANEAFCDFLKLDHFALVKSNIADDKEYAEVYHRFKDILALPGSYVEEMYASEYARHFYRQEEVAAFATKWMGQLEYAR